MSGGVAGPGSSRPAIATVSAVAGLAFVVPAAALSWPASPQTWMPDIPLHGFGTMCVLLGYVAWIGYPASRIGPIVLVLGVVYQLNSLRASTNAIVFGIGMSLAFAWVAVVAHLILAWPTGRLAGRGSRALLVGCYGAAILSQVAHLVIDRPMPPVTYNMPYQVTPTTRVGSVLLIVLAVVVVVVTARRWLGATDLRRRWRAPFWGAVVVVSIPLVTAASMSIVRAPVRVESLLIATSMTVAVVLIPVIWLAHSSNTSRARWRLARVVLDRVRMDELKLRPELLQQAMADALGDPTLRIVYPIGTDQYVDVDGRVVAEVTRSPGRAVTPVEQAGQLVAVIEHDEVLDERNKVAATVANVAGIAIENARMYATLRAQIEQVRTSRLRLSAAALEERHRIQQDLHDGSQQQFFAVLVLLDLARRQLEPDGPTRQLVDRAHHQLNDAIKSLRELAQGIYPAVLTEHGLAAAIANIGDLSPIPITVDARRDRWPGHVEMTAYFVVAESITNAYKHADATHVDVRIAELGGDLVIEVSDDGRGGAQFLPGSGLSGMQDRVHTVGGHLSIESDPIRGTVVRATIPLELP